MNYPIENLSESEKWAFIRFLVNKLLDHCAWTQLPDAILTGAEKDAWQTYRETLQGLEFAFSNPDDVIFPDAPAISSMPPTSEQLTARDRRKAASVNAAAIPGWATWTEAEALTWGQANIGTPLAEGRTNLPATLTLATTRIAILQIITILDSMWVMLWALARMVIALRDEIWPERPGQ